MTKPCTLTFRLNGHTVAVSSFPCLRREAAGRFPSALASTEWSSGKADLRILAVHATFESATCGPASYRFRGGDNVVPREAIPAEFDYVACGHVHRYQALSLPNVEKPRLVYAGSPDRISFAERDEPKGFVMIEETGGRLVHRFVEHEVRPMSIHPLVVGTDDVRYEVRIDDGLGTILGYCYIFTAVSPPEPPDPADYVSYSFNPIDPILEDTTVITPLYRLHYGARWRLDELAVLPVGGGSGMDMIDRFKYREATDATAFGGETEETWDTFSCFLGHRDGPVRVLREIQGAASGVNTTQTVSI